MPRTRKLISALMLIGFAVAFIRLAMLLIVFEPATATMAGLIAIWLQRALEVPMIFAVDQFAAGLGMRWRLLVHAAALSIVLLAAAGTLALVTVIYGPPLVPFAVTSPYILMMSVLLYVGVAAVSATARNSERLLQQELAEERLRRDAARSELKAMRAEFHPSTVVAALGRVETLLEGDVAAAERALTIIADFLSLTLRRFGCERVSLRAEAELAATVVQLRALCAGTSCETRVIADGEASVTPGAAGEWLMRIGEEADGRGIERVDFVVKGENVQIITRSGGEVRRISWPGDRQELAAAVTA